MAQNVDYDPDDDRLIDIDTHEKFNAIRHDLDGDGVSTHATYTTAFPNPATGQCPTSCQGYELTADISLSTYTNWTPIGGAYAAVFDGKGHTISGLTVTANTNDDLGLFGHLTSAGRITRVGVTGASVTGTATSSQELGILVGESHGVIRFSYTTGTVTSATSGTFHKTGGLVGHLRDGGSISASYSTATVVGPTSQGLGQFTGGLVGQIGEAGATTAGTVTAAYASGAVSAASNNNNGRTGGLVGFVRRGSVNQSYAYGSVTSTTNNYTLVGGLVGERAADGAINNSYYDSTTSGRSDTGRGGPEPTADLQNPLDYAGTIFAAWNVNVDGVAGADDPWDFGTASQYPALQVDFNDDGTDSAFEFGGQGRPDPNAPPVDPNPPRVQPPARGGGQPYNWRTDHPEIYANARHGITATCAVETTGEDDNAVTTATITFDLAEYTRPITLALSLWDKTHFRSLQSLGIPMPALQREGQTATVEVVTDPARTRFRLDGPYGLNLVLGYADCHTDDS